jgi:integrase
MGSVRVRQETGTLYFDFRYQGIRCREQTLLKDTAANRRRMTQVMEKIEAEITLGTFNYRGYFPNSPMVDRIEAIAGRSASTDAPPRFETFAEDLFEEFRVAWKASYAGNVRVTLRAHLIPHFGHLGVDRISKADILKFRASLAKVTSRNKKPLSNDRINHIMTPLRMILRSCLEISCVTP